MEKTMSLPISFESVKTKVKASYVAIVLSVLGLFALITATLVAWPAVAYFASKLF